MPGQPNSSYDALECGEEWLLGGLPAGALHGGVFRPVLGEGVREIAKWSADGARSDSAFGGGEREVYRLERRAPGEWAVAEVVARGTGSTSDLLALGDGWLWQATNWLALQRIDLRRPAAERQPEIVLPRDDREQSVKPSRGLVYLLRFEDRLLVASWRGFFRWNEQRRELERDAELSAFAFPSAPGVALAAAGRDWLCFQEDAPPGRVRLLERGPDGRLRASELSGGLLRGLIPEAVTFDRVAGRVWLGEGGRIMGFDTRPPAAAAVESVQAAVRSAVDAQGQIRWREGEGDLTLPPERREAVLDFAANDYEVTLAGRAALEFRTRLDGFDNAWSGWSGEARRGYTNLPPGRYRFEVEARTLAGRTVAAPPLTVVVPARWWESTWGRTALGLGAAGLLALVTARWAQRRLRERVRRLNVEAALQQERLRIARDMHDGVGSMLGRLQLIVDRAARLDDAEARGSTLAEASATTREMAAHTRDIIWAVTPENDTLDNLLDRLAETVQAAAQAAGLRCRFDIPAESQPLPVHAATRHQILLAVKEAVHNAVKHARASELRLRATLHGASLAVEVADDGCGFDPAGGGRPGGLGLESLRARAEAVAGEAQIDSAPGRGTVVRFLFPLQA
ncbi:MAG: ATP-binding protein [Verrucomicrobia bacterium]|nr:ATP-binding protein [Verrucomicrobiota bacterium]